MLRSKDCELLQGVTSPNSVSDNFLFQKNNNNNNNLKTQKMSSTILSSNMLVAGNNNNGMISESKDSHANALLSKFANGNTRNHAFSTISSGRQNTAKLPVCEQHRISTTRWVSHPHRIGRWFRRRKSQPQRRRSETACRR